MKYKKGLALLLVCFALIGTTWLTASATASKPYGSYSTTISSSSATARISKCSCNQVNNYLMAAIQVQYRVQYRQEKVTAAIPQVQQVQFRCPKIIMMMIFFRAVSY